MPSQGQRDGEKQSMRIGTIILAGGNCERMFFPKPFLPFDDHKTFLEQITDAYILLPCDEIICVLNKTFLAPFAVVIDSLKSRVKFVYNPDPAMGRLHSVKLGLAAIRDAQSVFIHNADNPYAGRNTLIELIQHCPSDGYAAPQYEGQGGHPILLSGHTIMKLKDSDEKFTLKEVLADHNKIVVDVGDDKILFNVNTPGEYEKYFSRRVPSFQMKPG